MPLTVGNNFFKTKTFEPPCEKTCPLISHQVTLKPTCSPTKVSFRLKIEKKRNCTVSAQKADWSMSLLSAYAKRRFSNKVAFSTLFEPRHEKTNVLVSNQVRHKPGCAATEDG